MKIPRTLFLPFLIVAVICACFVIVRNRKKRPKLGKLDAPPKQPTQKSATKRKSIPSVFTFNIFFIYGIIQAVIGAIAILVGIISCAVNDSTFGLIPAVIGLSAVLLSVFVISWGIVVESVARTANNTELLVKHCSTNGILYDKSETSIVYVPKTIQGSITVPNTVTSIGSVAFSGCSMITNITLPDTITSIGNALFSGCSMLKNITLPKKP